MALDADAIAAAAQSCPSVARLSGGLVGEVATFLPGRRVTGVRLLPEEVEVHVVARWDRPLQAVAEEVRVIVAPLSEGLPVAVFIDDIETPDEEREQELGPLSGSRVDAPQQP
jgi:hypothetical protein